MKRNNNSSPFPFYVGVKSLEDLANKNSRVVIMNIMGGESSKVTPVSHAYSGGNVVAGVQYGKAGEIVETPIGNIPVYGSVKDIIEHGIKFDTGVIYLPPSAVSHAVSELCAGNDDLKQIVIVTEKVSVRDSRYIRWGCQRRGVDVIGANSLGVANSWDKVRIGGALGGDKPQETLVKGSVAIHSNSGNFSTTISEYIKTAGYGTSTIVSSGKDVYIHFGLPEFLYAAENDPRTKAVIVYVEPGGYYEYQALKWIEEGLFKFTKPIIAVVTGRWKKDLTRAVGHAGALSGSGDDAIAKEQFFDSYFGMPEYNPKKPKVSPRGIRVPTIQQIPEALAAVMQLRGEKSDFEPIGDLSLKPWFINHQGIIFPRELDIDSVIAMPPYDKEIEEANHQVGAQYLRQTMRNNSGATRMNRKTDVTEIHGRSLLDLVSEDFGASGLFAVLREMPTANQMHSITPVLNWFISEGTGYIDYAVTSRKNGATPNAYIGASVLMSGNNVLYKSLQNHTRTLIDLFYVDIGSKLDIEDDLIEKKLKETKGFFQAPASDKDKAVYEFLMDALKKHSLETIFTRFVNAYEKKAAKDGVNSLYLLIAAILLSVAWKPLTDRRISRSDAENLGTYLAINGIIVSNAVVDAEKNKFWTDIRDLKESRILETNYTESCFRILFNRKPEKNEVFALNSLFNLTITNGPGTLSAKGAKESVSAKNYISTVYAGFMMNTGLAHGGNGFEAIAFLVDKLNTLDPYGKPFKEIDPELKKMAAKVASDYLGYKKVEKSKGNMQYNKIPCTNHPVFKGKPVNNDPREEYVRELFKKHSIVNPFLEFYHHLVVELHRVGATDNVFCVNIDAVIATVSLELFWKQFKSGEIKEDAMKDLVFSMFLFGRMVGTAAEVSDHLNRGTDMDCRTPASEVNFVN
ncbi:MAG: CoA-binding protein [Spirochaetia bacterium]|nr:CoA-binding protein [Spirochaetia bacterium]